MSHRDFELTATKAEAPTFSVAGRSFKCLPEPPAGVLMDVVSIVGADVSVQAKGIVGFILGCLPESDAEQFELLIHDKDTIVPLEALGEIVEWLVGEYNGRPTTPSSGSGAGSLSTPVTSADGAGSAVSTLPTPASAD